MKGIKVHEREIKKVHNNQKVEQAKEDTNLTFKPKLCKKSLQMVQERSHLSDGPREVELFRLVE